MTLMRKTSVAAKVPGQWAKEIESKAHANLKYADGESDEFEFGGPFGAPLFMLGFPLLIMWIGATCYDGMLPLPAANQTWADFVMFLCKLVYEEAYPTRKAWVIYWIFFIMEAITYCYLPGVSSFGCPFQQKDETSKYLPYYCSAYCGFYATLATATFLHITDVFPLYTVINEFGSIMSVAISSGFLNSVIVYIQAIVRGRAHRLSGSVIYNFFVGPELNPPIGILDFKIFYEVRIPWFILFLIIYLAAALQYENNGFVSKELLFLIGAHFLYANACGKGEQMIITSW